MRIPSGDLSPARRRRYGGGYAQRRRRTLRSLLALVLLLLVGGGAYYYLSRDDATVAVRKQPAIVIATPGVCTTGPAAALPPAPGKVALPAPATVRLTLLNGTLRNGLGRTIGNQLAARGFKVAGTGNAPGPQVGASTVVFGPGGQPAATLLARTVLGATMTADPKAVRGSVIVVLGSTFSRLRTPAEVAALGAVPAPAPAPTPAPTSTCR